MIFFLIDDAARTILHARLTQARVRKEMVTITDVIAATNILSSAAHKRAWRYRRR